MREKLEVGDWSKLIDKLAEVLSDKKWRDSKPDIALALDNIIINIGIMAKNINNKTSVARIVREFTVSS
jgi:hypothetical protein